MNGRAAFAYQAEYPVEAVSCPARNLKHAARRQAKAAQARNESHIERLVFVIEWAVDEHVGVGSPAAPSLHRAGRAADLAADLANCSALPTKLDKHGASLMTRSEAARLPRCLCLDKRQVLLPSDDQINKLGDLP